MKTTLTRVEPKTDYGKKKLEIIKLVRAYCHHAYHVHQNSKVSRAYLKADIAWSMVQYFSIPLESRSILDICTLILRVKSKLIEIMVNPKNPSYADSLAKLYKIKEFINDNFLFKHG